MKTSYYSLKPVDRLGGGCYILPKEITGRYTL